LVLHQQSHQWPLGNLNITARFGRVATSFADGMDASQCKDYVLVLLFMKYVSDKAAANPGYLLEVATVELR
jgi:type I restriction enzyme M protein